MSLSKETIIFTSCAAVVLLLLTHLVNVNIETGFIALDSMWLSHGMVCCECDVE